MMLQNYIMVKINGFLFDVCEGWFKGKLIDLLEVCVFLLKLVNEIVFIMFQELKLFEKFEFGDKLCINVLKEEILVDDMIDFCLQNRNKFFFILFEEYVMWFFFVNGIIFSFDLFWKLFKLKFLEYGKDIFEVMYDLYVSGKLMVSDYC